MKKYSRGGLGYGISVPLPIGENFNLHLYQNVLILNANNKGDV